MCSSVEATPRLVKVYVQMITAKIPQTWKELQQKVAVILRQCGLAVQVERVVSTARGHVEIDVYAEETRQSRTYVIVCECKNWTRRVPQHVIHSFRTVVNDCGADRGYIVSSRGFQSGASTAASLTNIHLCTWQQIQSEFESTWLERYLIPAIAEGLPEVRKYTHLPPPIAYLHLTNNGREEYLRLGEEHQILGSLLNCYLCHSDVRAALGHSIPTLPLREWIPRTTRGLKCVPGKVLNAQGYEEFLEALLRYGTGVQRKFSSIFAAHWNPSSRVTMEHAVAEHRRILERHRADPTSLPR